MAAHSSGSSDEDSMEIVAAAEELKDSFEEMSTLTDELSGAMNDVANGFASFRESTNRVGDQEPAAVGRQSGHAVADD